MTLYEFKLLPDEKQYEITFTQGDFIDYYLAENVRYALYAVDKFFVEVKYNVKKNKVVNIISFIEGSKLNRYSRL